MPLKAVLMDSSTTRFATSFGSASLFSSVPLPLALLPVELPRIGRRKALPSGTRLQSDLEKTIGIRLSESVSLSLFLLATLLFVRAFAVAETVHG